ncbi:hypothetical protein BCR33DRAFT_638687, partial [Rhizoclosmatium globosum]
DNLVFLDEVSIDNRDFLRKKGWGLKGQSLVYRSEYSRKPRLSLLCFIGATGLLEVFSTDGTFDRLKFLDCCSQFALGGKVKHFPGLHSVWIMDGAKIHCDPNISFYLRSLGIVLIYLPAYCPFYNPIEVMFAMVK